METPLDPSTIATVKATAPAIRAHGEAITALFYANLLSARPDLRDTFDLTSQATGRQARALAAALLAYAEHVDDLPALGGFVRRVAHRHASLGVREADYAAVGEHLIAAVGAVLGAEVATPEVAAAWAAAFARLAGVFIGVERGIYESHLGQSSSSSEEGEGGGEGWVGWRRFTIRRKVRESDEITSFYLAPSPSSQQQDDKQQQQQQHRLPPFQPGQYVSLRLWVGELGCFQPRQYSLSDAPPPRGGGYGCEHYRISVKRRDARRLGDDGVLLPGGRISNLLHDAYGEGDVVELTHPTGDFYLDVDADADAVADSDTEKGEYKETDGKGGGEGEQESSPPLVLLSAGVGITPMVAMLNGALRAAASPRPPRRIAFVHGARSAASRAFGAHLDAVAARHRGVVDLTVFLSAAGEAEAEQEERRWAATRVVPGRVDLSKAVDGGGEKEGDALLLGRLLRDARARYYVCGPAGFMRDVRAALVGRGVDEARIRSEVFGVGSG